MKQKIYSLIWWLSESSGIGLGKHAPRVFEGMMGFNKGVELDDAGRPVNKEDR